MNRYRSLLLALTWAASVPAASLPTYRIDTVAGSSLLGDGGAATLAQIGNIQGVAADRLGNIYLSDTDHHRIRKINSSGAITTVAGTGSAGFSGDGGSATQAQLNFPYGLTVDAGGYLYIADLGNNRVRRVAPDGSINTYAGGGQSGLGDGGPATSAQLSSPRNVTVDSAGNLYLCEFQGHRVRKVTPDGRISTVAGTGIAGFGGDGGLAVNAQLAAPAGLTVDRAGALYIADSQNQRIRKILPNGAIVTLLGGSAASTLLWPVGVAVDSAGDVFAVDAGSVVRCYNIAGAWINVAGTGVSGFSGDGGPGASAMLTAPRELALDASGNLLIADAVRLRRMDSHGVIQTVAGDAYVHAVGDGSSATSGILAQPSAVALDAGGNLYIADTGTQRVRQVSPAGTITTVAGTGTAGYDHDQVPAASAELNAPMGVAAGLAGIFWIADTANQRIRMVNGGTIVSLMASTSLGSPRGVCVDSAGTMYVVDTGNHRVLQVGLYGVVATIAGTGTPGSTGDGGQARLAQLNQPGACAVDSQGNLFIADTFGHRIRKVTPAGIISAVAGTGVAGSALDEVAATTSPLNTPQGVAVDASGNLFISDTANNRIREVTTDGLIHTIAGQGVPGFGGDGGPGSAAQISTPMGLVVDNAGNVYFADSLNGRIRRLTSSTATVTPPTTLAAASLSVVNAASLAQGAVAPGESVTIYGTGIGPQAGVAGTFDATGLLGTQLGGTAVRFDGVPSPLFYVQAGQINAQVPYTVAGATATHLDVIYLNQPAGSLDLTVVPAAPALFAAIANQDGTINSPGNPAARGTIVTLYGTGEGLTTGANIAGKAASPPYASPAAPIAISIGGVNAQLLYAGSAPGFAGLLQLDAIVPGGSVPPGRAAVTVIVGSATSPAVTIWLQ